VNFVPVQPRRQPRRSGWRLWLLFAWRWAVVGFLASATVWATVQWATEPDVPASAVPVVAGLYVLMVFAAAAPR
jgi:hypothetical protein